MLLTALHTPLIVALIAMLIAQIVKVPLYWLFTSRFKPELMFSTGGMPSSHSAMVSALAISIGLERGFNSDLFAIAAIVALIVMYDAMGIRRHAGKQATILNELIKELQKILAAAASEENQEIKFASRQKLKELLGHEPIEVFFGALTGIIAAIGLNCI